MANEKQVELRFDDNEIWERALGESAPAYGAFCAYRDLGPNRTLRAACRSWRGAGKTAPKVNIPVPREGLAHFDNHLVDEKPLWEDSAFAAGSSLESEEEPHSHLDLPRRRLAAKLKAGMPGHGEISQQGKVGVGPPARPDDSQSFITKLVATF